MNRELSRLYKSILSNIRDLYLEANPRPWIVGFSGGKDSTLVLQLTLEMLQRLAPDQRKRKVFIVSNDTLVESPVYHDYLLDILEEIKHGIENLDLPVQVLVTKPEVHETFWVNLIGKGYPAPNRNFRWCTDRLKVRPTTKTIKSVISKSGEVILLLGVRHDESITRSNTIKKYTNNKDFLALQRHSKVADCFIYRPIIDVTLEQVWSLLTSLRPPWGGNHNDLCTIYRNASAGNTAYIEPTEEVDNPVENMARFGCWTCTVVKQDKSLESLVENGHDQLKPLLTFREFISSLSETPEYRSKTRRNGQSGLGPFTYEARKILLSKLLETQAVVGFQLVSEHEINLIQEQWAQDKFDDVRRKFSVR